MPGNVIIQTVSNWRETDILKVRLKYNVREREKAGKKRNRNLQLYLLIIVSLWLQCANISICHSGF